MKMINLIVLMLLTIMFFQCKPEKEEVANKDVKIKTILSNVDEDDIKKSLEKENKIPSKISKDIQIRDEELSSKFNLGVETIKKEVNRLIGLGIWEIYDKEAEFESQDIVFNVDLVGEPKVKIQINPLYIEGITISVSVASPRPITM